jgi:hypothetical protein
LTLSFIEWRESMKSSTFLVAMIITLLGLASGVDGISQRAHAGCYSDWCAGKSSGSTSSYNTLKYGGTYGQAAQNYNNYRWGYGTGRNTQYHSPYVYPGTPAYQPMTPAQKAEINRLNAQSDALINRIMNDQLIWGR